MLAETAVKASQLAKASWEAADIVGSVFQFMTFAVALAALSISIHNWLKANEKRKILTDPNEAFEVVPAWFTKRMMQDYWYFALLLSTGKWVLIEKISGISSDGKWIEVELAERGSTTLYDTIDAGDLISSLTEDRLTATIRAADVVLATEAADT